MTPLVNLDAPTTTIHRVYVDLGTWDSLHQHMLPGWWFIVFFVALAAIVVLVALLRSETDQMGEGGAPTWSRSYRPWWSKDRKDDGLDDGARDTVG